MEIGLHGYHPSEIVDSGLLDAHGTTSWEIGATHLTLIHATAESRDQPWLREHKHGLLRPLPPPCPAKR